MTTLPDFFQKKENGEKITLLTCYDATFSALFRETEVDAVLVGDSAAMVIHGQETTLPMTLDLMIAHVAAVHRGNKDLFIIADMPFGSFRKDLATGVASAVSLLQAGAHAVKLEGAAGNEEIITQLVDSGIPVMGHLGLTPQFFNQFGGFRVQGKDPEVADKIRQHASQLQEWGCFSLVLECVPEDLAEKISGELRIPVIGIGAGRKTDGQVLVLYDLLGLGGAKKPRFVRSFMDGNLLVRQALKDYTRAVKEGTYPSESEVYH